MPFRLLLPLALVGLATPLAAQSRGIRTYANPVDLDYRYNWEQLNRGISYRSGADPVVSTVYTCFRVLASDDGRRWTMIADLSGETRDRANSESHPTIRPIRPFGRPAAGVTFNSNSNLGVCN